MADPRHDPSVEHEPHLHPQAALSGDPSERRAAERLSREAAATGDDADGAERTVWDEPALSPDLAGPPPEGALTYARWLDAKILQTPSATGWLVTLGVVLAAGPCGVLGAIWSQARGQTGGLGGVLAVVVLAPLTEEIAKIACALWIVEKRPYWFTSLVQILVCAGAGGLAFGLIENLIYLNLYIPDAGPTLRAWRWSVCTGLHLNCSLVAGVGLARIWGNAIRERRKPQLALGMPWFATAMLGHGLYNAFALVGEVAGWIKLD